MKDLLALLITITMSNLGFSQIENLQLEVQTSKNQGELKCLGTVKLLNTVDTLSLFGFDYNYLGLCRYKIDFANIENTPLIYDVLVIEDKDGNYYSPIEFMPKAELRQLKKYECEYALNFLIITKVYFHELIKITLSYEKLKTKQISEFRLCYLTLDENNADKNYLLKSNWVTL